MNSSKNEDWTFIDSSNVYEEATKEIHFIIKFIPNKIVNGSSKDPLWITKAIKSKLKQKSKVKKRVL